MRLSEQLNQDYITAMKERNTEKVGILRLLMSSLKNEAIKLGGLDTVLTDEQELAVLNREVKQRNDSISQYTAAGRPELAEKESAEIALIEAYLPQAMSDEELEAVITAVLTETGATQKSDMGKVMGALKQKLSNPADVAKAAQKVSQNLA